MSHLLRGGHRWCTVAFSIVPPPCRGCRNDYKRDDDHYHPKPVGRRHPRRRRHLGQRGDILCGESEHLYRASDVLDGPLAKVRELEWQLIPDRIAHSARYADAAGLGERLQSRRYIDAVAVDVLSLHNNVAQVNTHAKLKLFVRRNAGIASYHAALHFDRAANRLDGARELDQDAIAGRLHDPAAMFIDFRVD